MSGPELQNFQPQQQPPQPPLQQLNRETIMFPPQHFQPETGMEMKPQRPIFFSAESARYSKPSMMCSLGQPPSNLDNIDAKMEKMRLDMIAQLKEMDDSDAYVIEGKQKASYL